MQLADHARSKVVLLPWFGPVTTRIRSGSSREKSLAHDRRALGQELVRQGEIEGVLGVDLPGLGGDLGIAEWPGRLPGIAPMYSRYAR